MNIIIILALLKIKEKNCCFKKKCCFIGHDFYTDELKLLPIQTENTCNLLKTDYGLSDEQINILSLKSDTPNVDQLFQLMKYELTESVYSLHTT